MRNIYIMFAAFFAFSYTLGAQDLDPTVEVSRVYEGKIIEVHKPALDMSVPDTVHRFDLDFDYSVFENPYRGSYEFNPYTMDVKPEAGHLKPSQFYLNAGAGYTLHPVLDLLYSPDLEGNFSIDVYARHKSYIGDYRALHPLGVGLCKNGYDFLSQAGVDFGYDWQKASVDFGASYYGVAVKDLFKKDDFNALDAYFALKSKALWPKHFMYDVKAAYRYGGDAVLTENNFRLDATFGPSFNESNKVFIDLGVELDSYSRGLTAMAGRFYMTPHYIRNKNKLKMDLGFRVSMTVNSGDYVKANQYIYPELHFSYAVGKDLMRLYLNVTGGEKLNTYSSLLKANHHFSTDYRLGGLCLLSATVERVRPELGIEGRISTFFSYDIRGGYVNYKYTPLEVLVYDSGSYRPGLGYTDMQQAYAAFDWALRFQSFKFEGVLNYAYSWGVSDPGPDMLYVRPAELTGQTSAVYNWNKRIYAGVDCAFATAAATADESVCIPGYADLGIYAEYELNRKISVWLRGGNLLNMEIQRNPLFAEKGINFTAGICLNL